jgi:hypothetical protein
MAASANSSAPSQPGQFVASSTLKTVYSVFILIGVLAFALGLMKDQERIWHSFLVSFFFFTSLGLGGTFFLAINHAAGAGWSVNIRRFPEAMASFLPIAAVGGLVLLFGAHHLYEWLDAKAVAQDYILQGKASYLNGTFFAIRVILFFGLWLLFAGKMVGNSVQQDQTGADSFTNNNLKLGVIFLLVFALSYSLFGVDTMMSLQPHWYSTMFGVYCFAGLFQSSLAFITILTVFMMKKGLLRGLVNENHLHDMGKYMMAFTIFYAYIAFSQYMLIWYANLPEETIFYLNRSNGPWMAVSLSLVFFKFAIPFLLLLPKAAKRTPSHLVMVASLILVMQVVDDYWLVYPNLNNNQILLSWQEVGVFLGFLGLFLWSLVRFLSTHNLVPIRDPRREESIHHEVVY